MGVSAAWAVAAVTAAAAANSADQSRYATHTAQDEAKRQRALLEQLKAEPAQEMPTPGEQQAAKRRSIASAIARRGRASTILTGDDSLGA